jgi:HlyD family secretion protein
MLRRIIMFLVLAGVAGLLAWALWPKPVPVTVAQIARQPLSVFVEEEGKTRIREVYTVSAPITGKMLRSSLHEGDRVTEGETVVVRMQPTDPGLLDIRSRGVAEAAVGAAQAAVSLAEAQVNQARSTLSFAQSELRRATTLIRQGTIPERNLDKAKLDAATAEAELASAEANLEVRRRELESARAALIEGTTGNPKSNCCVEVKAPASGEVLRVVAESEQTVQAGAALIEIGNPRDIEVEADLLSRDAVRVVTGARAIITGWGGEPLDAKVTKIDPAAVTKVSALGIEEQRVNVVLALDGDAQSWERLGHGYRVVVRIEVWHKDDALTVPLGALFRRGEDWAAFVVANGVTSLRTLRIGERNTSHAELLEGLTEGEAVVLHPSDVLSEGSKVVVE